MFVRNFLRTARVQLPTYRQTLGSTFQVHRTMTGAAATDTEAAQNANSSGVTPQSLEAKLASQLEAQYVEIEDMSGMIGCHSDQSTSFTDL